MYAVTLSIGRSCRRAALALCAVVCTAGLCSNASAAPSFDAVQAAFRSSDVNLLDRHGDILQQLRRNPAERKLAWVRLDDISPALRTALLTSEDQRFYAHSGVDWNATANAAWNNLWNKRTRGASTITMQLAGLLDENVRRKSGNRTARQKLTQMYLAQSLERDWRKDQILEAYLNLVGFRGEMVGVHALSRVLFDKHPSGLNQRESAIAVALIRAPNAPVRKVTARACLLLKQQHATDPCSALDGFVEQVLARPASRIDTVNASAAPQLAPHLAQRLLRRDGASVRSTLDRATQRFVRDALTRQLAALVERNIEDGAVVVFDNATGEVLAWVGSSGPLSDAAEVDGVLALRQAGSTLKPFLYELAIEGRWLTAASIIDDAPLNLATASGLYIPGNYDHGYKGLVSVRTALGASLNIPAVRTLVTVTPERFFQRLQALGFGLRESGDYYGYSLALGSADVSLLALTNAYRTLANQGRYSNVRTTFDVPQVRAIPVLDPSASFIVSDILADSNARARTFGLESALSTRVWSAVKTGTSKDMRDNWCVGYSERYTVGVWVGNASGAPMWDVSGVTGAAPIWQEVMQYLHATPASSAPAVARSVGATSARFQPAGVRQQIIRYQNNLEAPREEYFLRGTEQNTQIQTATDQQPAHIHYPTPGMLIALDPDIPPANQRLRFVAQGVKIPFWVLDGKALIVPSRSDVSNKSAFEWMPRPGKHILSLLDRQGTLLDQVRFEVRGARERVVGVAQRRGTGQ